MSDQPADLVLEQLRLLRAELAAMKAEMRSDFSDVKARLASLNRHSQGFVETMRPTRNS